MYSFEILDLGSLTTLAKHSTASFVERYAFIEFQTNLLLNRSETKGMENLNSTH